MGRQRNNKHTMFSTVPGSKCSVKVSCCDYYNFATPLIWLPWEPLRIIPETRKIASLGVASLCQLIGFQAVSPGSRIRSSFLIGVAHFKICCISLEQSFHCFLPHSVHFLLIQIREFIKMHPGPIHTVRLTANI